MPVPTWLGKRRGARGDPKLDATKDAGTLIRAAARGDSLDHLLDFGVQSLLRTSAADRVGLWLSREGRGRGRILEDQPGPTPEQWKHLDISAPFLQTALESVVPLRMDLDTVAAVPLLGPLVGMGTAIWISLHAGTRAFGLAMVAYERAGATPNLDLLVARVDEIALAVGQHHDAARIVDAAEELRGLSALSRAILCGVSADSILYQIARAARTHTRAAFVTLGRGGSPPSLAEAWDVPEDWRGRLEQEHLLRLWHTAYEQGRVADIVAGESQQGQEGSLRMGGDPKSSHTIRNRVIAIPIEARNRTIGVLMAGFLASDDLSEEIAQLEPYVLLAATALDREVSREESIACKESLRSIIEESNECLIAVDAKGFVREASRAAAALLFPPWGRPQEMLLEDLFAPGAREAVEQWRHQVMPLDSLNMLKGAHEPEKPQVTLEAVLLAGSLVRLQVRSEIAGLGCRVGGAFGEGAAMWLVHVENHEQAAHETEDRLEVEMAALVDSIESGVLLLDAAGNIRMVSDRLAAILGCESRRLLELGTIEALMEDLTSHFSRPAETVARWRDHVRRGDESSWDEFELVRPSRKIVERFARPLLKPDGSRQGWLEVYRDITGQRLIQSKLLQTEKMAALGQLVSGIAHELNNPLTSIQGYAQLLLGRQSDSRRAGDARRISQEAERAGRIVKNLLLFSRETKPERRAVNLNEVIERTLALRAYELKLENIDVELMLDPGLPPTLADAAQLQQVILNLIVNAEQAIQQGRGEGSQQGRIHLRTRRLAGDRIGLEVSDDGPGISPEIVARIFDPFFTTKPVGVGTGLGLSIVYGIVQEHGGEVSVESQAGHGATLSVELPALSVSGIDFAVQERAVTPQVADGVPIAPSVKIPVRRERVLVVEDEPTVAALIADVLSDEGYRVETLLDSREALGRLEKKRYGLVICDLKMPNLDGPSLYRALLSGGGRLLQKLLFVTGDTMSPRTLEFLQSSGLPYLAKPFLVDELKEAVRQAIFAAPLGNEEPARPAESNVVARVK